MLAQERQCLLGQQIGTLHVHIEDLVPHLLIALEDTADRRIGGCIADQNVQLAKLVDGLLEELFAILGFADMALQTVDIQVQFAQLCQSRVHILLLATADDHCGAIFGQPFGNRETNAGRD